MAKKIILEDSQGNVLHPKTLGECVTTETGETVDGLVSKSQMFSPIIETDSSMSKVGVGTDIDVSLNVKDGAYEECVFEGRSLVNLIPAKTVFEKQAIGGTSGWRNSYLPLTQELKTNTIYTLFYKLETETKVQISIGGKNGDAFLLKSEPIREVGTHYVQTLLTTKPETSNSMSHLYIQFPDNFDVGTVKATNMVLLEGNYMDFNVPYFEGICDSKMPILRNIGKNLFDVNNPTKTIQKSGLTTYIKNNQIHFNGSVSNYAAPYEYAISLESNKTYSFNYSTFGNFPLNKYPNDCCLRIMKNSEITRTIWGGANNTTFHLADGENGIRFDIRINKVWEEGEVYSVNGGIENIQLEESSSFTTYESYKTNILRTSEEIVLREVDGVQDTYNGLTGEYVKRIEECVLDGSQALSLDGSLVYLGLTDRPINNSGIADKVPVITVNQLLTGEFGICMQDRGASGRIYINIEGLTTREEILQYLRTNPITVQYELAEPITTIIKPSTIPFAYQNGHVILESGSSEQSLLPHLKYSVVTGRTGQVTQNTKVLRKQEQQIIGLEELLLTQIVQMEYERTLLQFDYELQMMMLG